MSIKPELSWSVSWSQEIQELAWRYDDRQIKLARKHGRWQWAWMVKQADATFSRGLLHRQAQLTLSSYCLGAFPLQFPYCYLSGILAALPCNRMSTSQLPPLHLHLRAHWLQTPQAVQLVHPELCHIQYLPYQISPLQALPWWGAHLLSSLVHPHTEKVGPLFLADHFSNHHNKLGLHVNSQEVKTRSEQSSAQANEDMHLNWYWYLGPALTSNKGRNLPAPLPVQPGPPCWSWWWYCGRKFEEYQWNQASSDSDSSREDARPTLIWIQLLGDCFICSDIDQSYHMNCLEEVPRLNWKGLSTVTRPCGDTTM